MCILITTRNILLGDILENLLANIFSVHIHQIFRVNSKDLSERINDFQPDVIVLEEGLIGELSLWSRQQLYHGRIRIILVSPQENRVQVSDQFPITLTQISDFTALFENIPPVPYRLTNDRTH